MAIFPEEQLDSAVGYFPARPGQTLKDGRWAIVRKVGWGPRSSTWLAVDNSIKRDVPLYSAIKIFTKTATEDSTGNNERNILLIPALQDISSGIPQLMSYFYEHDANGKRHLCLVIRMLGTSVEDLRLTNIYDEYLPIHIVKKVVSDISCKLSHLAEQKIIHGAVTPDNFLMTCAQSGYDIQPQLKKSTNKKPEIKNIVGSDGVTYPAVISQPLPHGYKWDSTEEDMEYTSINLSNFSYGAPVTSLDARKNLNFLAPEVLRNGTERIDIKSDIWSLGCSTFLLLTGSPLFSDSYVASPISTAKETLGKIESLLTESGKVAANDISPAAVFLRSCLAIKPKDRASPTEIIFSDWVKDVL
ncbi:hypothetical protein M413DRAFT_13773 [Hebeloma cylindrosporum]|uniref:non-specific serine/threonine protein kinase n=1 Tax=Hebeloma cylindrosporum TaxID=76867 RepID=A0A0C3BZE0_HEBCY|nr:hypothetical protein M413DRAFT_13773 [Hebeloma cylindrosporum h7]